MSASDLSMIAESQPFADCLLRKGVNRGEAVILVMTEPESAVKAILGCMIAGCPPTPVYPPQNLSSVPSFHNFIKHVAKRSRASFLVANAQPFLLLGNVPHEVNSVKGIDKFEHLLNGATPLEFSREAA